MMFLKHQAISDSVKHFMKEHKSERKTRKLSNRLSPFCSKFLTFFFLGRSALKYAVIPDILCSLLIMETNISFCLVLSKYYITLFG